MHERNIYKTPPDFAKLAEEHKAFAKYVTVSSDGRGHLNFKDPEALRELTCTLLKHDFGLKLEIPLDRLIPTVPLRLNYILWIEDLVSLGKSDGGAIRGIDVGCGASCIYPLLGAKLNNWNFITSEFDGLSYSFALKNISGNSLTDNISLKKGSKETLLIDIVEKDMKYDFSMCNPPFFNDRQEASGCTARTDKRPPPHSMCTASDNETVTQGGEVEFVKMMIKESLELKDTIRWYTTMLGKKTSLNVLKQYLKEQKIPNMASTVFQQGKTTRWGLCWSFCEKPQDLQQAKSSPRSKANVIPFTFVVQKREIEKRYCDDQLTSVNEIIAIKLICKEIEKLLKMLQIEFDATSLFNDSGNFDHVYTGEAWKNTWSHQRQKRRMEKRLRKNEMEASTIGHSSPLVPQGSCGHENKNPSGIIDSPRPGDYDPEQKKESERDSNHNEMPSISGCGDVAELEKGSSSDKNCKLLVSIHQVDAEHESKANIGQKRTHTKTDQRKNMISEEPMFKYKILVSLNSDSNDTEPVKVDISCVEGNRENLHQFFMYLRNQLNGIQRQHKKK